MYFTHTKDGRTLTAALHGEIDHHSAKTARTQLDLLIERENPKVLRLQLADVGFCDSSGLGFIMGRLKKMSETGGAEPRHRPPAGAVGAGQNDQNREEGLRTMGKAIPKNGSGGVRDGRAG